MSVIGGSQPVVTSGLVYALDFSNQKTYVSGSTTVKSLVYDATTTSVNGPFNFDNRNLIFTGTTTSYIQRSGSIVTTNPNSDFTICMVTNVIRPGSFLVQNTSTVNFAAQISTSSFDIGFYNATTATYYTRRFPIVLNTGSLYVACRYSNGTIDLFLNGLPVTSSQSNVILDTQVTGSTRSDSLTYSTTGSLFIGSLPSSVSTFSGSLAQFSIYNRALTSTEIYSNYVPHINSQYQLGALSLTKPYTLDENTLMYVSASGISSSAYITAIDAFITGLKSNNIWNKLSVIYPAIGSTTSSQAINLKEPGVNRLVYTGSWSASVSGSYPITSQSYLQLSGFNYPTIATSSAHITYLSYDLPQVTASLVGVDKPLRALGGEIFYSGSKTYHVFKITGTSSFQAIDSSLTAVEVLVVAGGGAGGNGSQYNGGGGGAGGLIQSSSFAITPGSNIEVIVGSGGSSTPNTNGLNSKFSTIEAFGGGRGGAGRSGPGISGGSGGGGASNYPTDVAGGLSLSGSGTPGQGNNGAYGKSIYNDGTAGGTPGYGGGGGGAGSPGQTGSATLLRAGNGGSGSYFAQYAGLGLGFPAGWFAGGGAGSGNLGGTGGPGGGADGPPFQGPFLAIYNGKTNTGGGGGGNGYNSEPIGGVGGSGIVIVSYNTALATFTSSFGISLSGSNIVGNLHSTTNSGISFDTNASIGLVTVTRTGSTNISIHKDFNSSVITAPVTASILGSVYANASNFAGTVSKVSPYTLSYLSYGAGLSPDEVTTYHNLASKLQYDLGRALLLQGFPAAAAYSVRQISKNYPYAINVRRADDLQQDIGFVSGDLDTGSLLTFLTASISTALPGDTATPAVAYSVRKVRTLYTGSAMQIRRDSDDLTFDVGFDVAGNLDTGSLLSKMTSSLNTPALPGDYSGLAAAYSLRKVSSSYSGYAVEVRRSSDNYSASIGFDGSGNLNTASLASLIRTGSETPISTYSGLAAAYSLRKVVPGYAGDAIEVQSGSVSQSIGFDSFGDLNITAIRTFAGSGDAFIKTWYDQSGNGYHATQSVAANQPQIVSSGSIILKNYRPAIYGNGTSTNSYFELPTIQNTPTYFSIITVYSHNNSSYSTTPFAHRNSANDLIQFRLNLSLTPELQIRSSGTALVQVVGSVVPLNSQNLYFAEYNNITPLHSLVTNAGTPVTNTTSIVGTITATKNYIGGTSNNGTTVDSFLSGELQELLIYTSSQAANRTYIQNNINSYYGIYTPTSVSTENAFVKTWYDQSGNNRHATQTATGSQPLIVASGSLIIQNGKPAINFRRVNSNNLTLPVGSYTMASDFAVLNQSGSIGNYDTYIAIDTLSNQIRLATGPFPFNTIYHNPADNIYQDGRLRTSSNSYDDIRNTRLYSAHTSSAFSFTRLRFGGRLNTTQDDVNANIQEYLFFSTDQSTNRGLIEDNINGYYNIFTQSLASGSGYVTKWYDQSGNNSHVIQDTYSNQPLIISSGSIYTSNSKPAIYTINSTKYLTGSAYRANQLDPTSWFITYQLSGLQRQGIVSWGLNRDSGINFEPGADGAGISIHKYSGFAFGPYSSAWYSTDQSLFSWISTTRSVSSSLLYLNNNLASSSFKYGPFNTDINVTGSVFIGMGSSAGAIPIGARISEVILYSSDQTSNRPSINNNINNYFNIYAANSTTSSLFVTKWFDQSGNRCHATQSVATSQPLIVNSGSLITLFGKPSIQFNGVNSSFDLINAPLNFTNNSTNFFVHENTNGGAIFGTSAYRYGRFDSPTYLVFGSGTGTTVTTTEDVRTGSVITFAQSTYNPGTGNYGSISIYKNSRNVTVYTGSTSGGPFNKIGYTAIGGNYYTGKISEIISRAEYLEQPTRNIYESNINSYYRIY